MKVNLKTFPVVGKYSTSYHNWSSLSREYEKIRKWKEDFEAKLQEKIKRVENDHILLNAEDDIYIFPEEKILVVRSKGENHYYINTEEILGN